MDYVDGFVAAVPAKNRSVYAAYAQEMAAVFKEYGAIRVVECWEDDVPEGNVTSFSKAVERKPDEAVVFSWIVWPSKQARDEGWEKALNDPRMSNETNQMPFDGKRMIFGGFNMIVAE